MMHIHDQVKKKKIIEANKRYSAKAKKHIKHKEFQEGDLVWINLRKDRFPKLRQNKLYPRADEPFKILKKGGDNAYKIDLPNTYGVSTTFNIGDLRKHEADSKLATIVFKEGGNDPHMKDTYPNEEASADLDHLEGKQDPKEQLEEALGQNMPKQATDQATTYLTLQDPWGTKVDLQDLFKPGNNISIHGTSHQGPRVTLMIHTTPLGTTPRS